PLQVIPSSVTPSAGLTVTAHENGAFTATTTTGAGSFTFLVRNSQGTPIASPVTASLTFPAASGLVVHVVDGVTKAAIADYRWIIEEDRTFYIDPTKTTNPGPTGPIVPVLGVNFHTSYMPVVAQGCTGSLSCESGQTLLGASTVCDVSGIC